MSVFTGIRSVVLVGLFTMFSLSSVALALDPEEVVVVANARMAGSVKVAKYYMKKRGIPESHLLSLSLTLTETMKRREFEEDLRAPLAEKIKKLNATQRIAAVVVMFGVPLKVLPPLPTWDERERIRQLLLETESLAEDGQLSEVELMKKKTQVQKTLASLQKTRWRAAVDSELFLTMAGEYEVNGWVKNPYFLGYHGMELRHGKDEVLLVSRLDGPDLNTVYRLIDDALATEKTGLEGKAYFDARWPMSKEENLSGYTLYDSSIHKAAEITKGRLEVTLDEEGGLFPEKSCPDAALYCGWYSLGKYIDSFTWRRGAIGYHIASDECASLRDKSRPRWCMKMLEKGVAATIGPVYEPYVQGFPLPEMFFHHLVEGYMGLGEAYLVSLPYISWQVILIGDPLYQPFRPL